MQPSDRKHKRPRLVSQPELAPNAIPKLNTPKFRTEQPLAQKQDSASTSTPVERFPPPAPDDPFQLLQDQLRVPLKPPPPTKPLDPLEILQQQMLEANTLRAGQRNRPAAVHAPIPPKSSSVRLSRNIRLLGPANPSTAGPVDPVPPGTVPSNSLPLHPPQNNAAPSLRQPSRQSSTTSLKPASKYELPQPVAQPSKADSKHRARRAPHGRDVDPIPKPDMPKSDIAKSSNASSKRRARQAKHDSDVEILDGIRPVSKTKLQAVPSLPGSVHQLTAEASDDEHEPHLPAALIKKEPQDIRLSRPVVQDREVIEIYDSDDTSAPAPAKKPHSLSTIYSYNPHFAPRLLATPPEHDIDRFRDILLRGHRREDTVREEIELAREFQQNLQLPVDFKVGVGDLRSFHNAFSVRHTYASTDEYRMKMSQCLNTRSVQLQGELQRVIQNEEVLADLERLRVEVQDLLNPPL